ncbi:DNA alkylation repair protein [Bacillus sp. RG28]|uniref:DNA alkylation repair protein n=1 Tax=Gottfriedia endophytica TaxID=2820819 RepID=A0A940NPP4_9BACI|nr:DNA alkylation repair protein [Gottfriedia endophytica]MBP0724657.1 DNA alkylation repair protein [Gottfriedia endophytica]
MDQYTKELYDIFNLHQNETNRPSMESYLKNHFQFLGIKTPERRQLIKDFIQLHGLPNDLSIIKEIWDLKEREFQYVALDLLSKEYKKAEKERIEFYEQLITEKSWWDTVDTIAGSLISLHFLRFPDLIASYTDKWIHSENMWLQRAAILHQLKFKQHTNEEKLFSHIKIVSSSKEFFIQKAIGWALREYSKTSPLSVRNFVTNNEEILAPLSKREALKRLTI